MTTFYPDPAMTLNLSILRCRPHVLALPSLPALVPSSPKNLSWPPSFFSSPFADFPFSDTVELLVDYDKCEAAFNNYKLPYHPSSLLLVSW